MRRAEALELQRRVLTRGMHRIGSREPELLGRSGDIHVESAAAQPFVELAVGIVGKKDDYGLAIRSVRGGTDIEAVVAEIAERGPIDFRVVGPITALSAPWHQSKISPLWPGSSAAHHRVGLGTLGCFVTRRSDPTLKPHILSNNHVLARERPDNLPRSNDVIFHPAKMDVLAPATADTIAQLTHWVPLQAADNEVDAAIAELQMNVAIQPEVLDGLGKLTGVRPADEDLEEGEPVHKIGRSTGLTTGIIKAQRLEPVSVEFEIQSRSFRKVLEIEPSGSEPFCDRGDSGSLIVDDQHRAIGLLFGKAEQAETAYANPIHLILEALQIDLLF